MQFPEKPVKFCALDQVAVAMEEHLRKMQSDGHGDLVAERRQDGISLVFGTISVHAENYDIALIRLAGAILDDPRLGAHLLKRLRHGTFRI